jgi:arylsulfatase A
MNTQKLLFFAIFTCLIFTCLIFTLLSFLDVKKSTDLPNIVIIYADDMGYGDLNCQNPTSKIPTPNLDQLAAEGMRFSDAHSSSGICSPSRFSLLTGMYHWRRTHKIVNSFGKPMFKDSDYTLPQMLQQKGYATACIGKWHLGWDWTFKNPPSRIVKRKTKKDIKVYGVADIDWSVPIKGGPLDRGFDTYFGDGTINFPPYAWVQNDRFLRVPTEDLNPRKMPFNTKEGSWEFRPGPMVKNWNPYDVLPTLTKKTVSWIEERKNENPFFLYLALPSPHAPIIPNDEFIGTSKAGGYGDFMVQTDWVIGQVLKALKEKGLEENTIVIFSSDNGPEKYAIDRAMTYDHFSSGKFRGMKRDVWEGGHHVPFIVKWPSHIEPATVSKQLISQTDVMATLGAVVGADLPSVAAPDSFNLLPVWEGKPMQKPVRETTIHNTFEDLWAIRNGNWLFVDGPSGAKRNLPKKYAEFKAYKNFKTKGLLFDMVHDPEQRENLFEKYPEKVRELSKLLKTYKTKGVTDSTN